MDSYRKRQKGDWQQGKGNKGDTEERQYVKKEIKDQVKHDLEGQLVRHKSKRKRNKKAALKHTILWYQQKIVEFEQHKDNLSLTNYFRQALKEAQKKYEEEFGDK